MLNFVPISHHPEDNEMLFYLAKGQLSAEQYRQYFLLLVLAAQQNVSKSNRINGERRYI